MPAMSRIRNAAASVARNRGGGTACDSSQSASGGPFTLIEVVSTPLRKPAAVAGIRHGGPVAQLPRRRGDHGDTHAHLERLLRQDREHDHADQRGPAPPAASRRPSP